jgi:Zn-dependent protease
MSASIRCDQCGAEVAPVLRVCPACGRLVHAAALSRLADEAGQAESDGRAADAVARWRTALDLLPPDAQQVPAIRARIDGLTRTLDGSAAAPAATPMPRWLAPLGAAGLLLWKFKFVLAFVATKGKLLLTGLTQSGTLLSMLAAMGVYWTIFGWQFAAGFVLLIYVHEMGHVAALLRLGIKARAPMFIPGIGAVVRMEQYPASPREDARVGLAGPIWGLGSTLAAYALARAFELPLFAALTHAGAVINLFNLTPVWQLDGARGMHALARPARLAIAALVTAAFVVTGEGTLLLVGIAAWWKALQSDAPDDTDLRAFIEFAVLVVGLTALTRVRVPGVPGA